MDEQLRLLTVDLQKKFHGFKPVSFFDDISIFDAVPPSNDMILSVNDHNVIETVTIGQYPDGARVVIDGRRRILAGREANVLREEVAQFHADQEERKLYKKDWTSVTVPVIEYFDVNDEIVANLAAALNNVRSSNIMTDIMTLQFYVAQAVELNSGELDLQQALRYAARNTGMKFSRAKKLWGIGQLDRRFLDAVTEGSVTENNAAKIANLGEKYQTDLLAVLEENGKITQNDISRVKEVNFTPPSLPEFGQPEDDYQQDEGQINEDAMLGALRAHDWTQLNEDIQNLWEIIEDAEVGHNAYALLLDLLTASGVNNA